MPHDTPQSRRPLQDVINRKRQPQGGKAGPPTLADLVNRQRAQIPTAPVVAGYGAPDVRPDVGMFDYWGLGYQNFPSYAAFGNQLYTAPFYPGAYASAIPPNLYPAGSPRAGVGVQPDRGPYNWQTPPVVPPNPPGPLPDRGPGAPGVPPNPAPDLERQRALDQMKAWAQRYGFSSRDIFGGQVGPASSLFNYSVTPRA